MTRSDWVDQRLREDIISGYLKPGDRLITATLAERYSVSPTPLREALQRLAAEGLLDTTPQRGARVAPLSWREYCELHELRTVLEPMGLKSSILAASSAWKRGVSTASETFSAILSDNNSGQADREAAHRELHLSLLSGAGSDWLGRVLTMLAQHSDRYHAFASQQTSRLHVLAEHETLARLCLDGDVEGALHAWTAESERARDVVREVIEESGTSDA